MTIMMFLVLFQLHPQLFSAGSSVFYISWKRSSNPSQFFRFFSVFWRCSLVSSSCSAVSRMCYSVFPRIFLIKISNFWHQCYNSCRIFEKVNSRRQFLKSIWTLFFSLELSAVIDFQWSNRTRWFEWNTCTHIYICNIYSVCFTLLFIVMTYPWRQNKI